jgi:hypothetical protein
VRTRDPPSEQWLAGLEAGAGSSLRWGGLSRCCCFAAVAAVPGVAVGPLVLAVSFGAVVGPLWCRPPWYAPPFLPTSSCL